VLCGLFERERSLLGLLSQTAYASILKTFQALLDRKDVRPGCVISLQTFGAYGANFHPHCHAIISDGAFSADGAFLPLPSLDSSAVLQVFRRMLLLRLHKAERLTESFLHNLLSWVHPGFSVYAGPPVIAAEIASLEAQARYITRPAVAMDSLQKFDDGKLVMDTPPDPRTGATSITLDPLDWIHRLSSHIPNPGRACASSPLLQMPAWSTVSCAIWEAAAGKRRIPSNQGRRPASLQTFRNNSEATADAGLFNRTLVRQRCVWAGKISAGKRGIQDREGLDGEKSAFMLSEFPSNPSPS
jgi:hypothetical protein